MTISFILGIQIDGCANYKISRNVFREGNLGDFTSAIWATNSGSDQANYIYNNYFGEPGKVSEFQNGIFAFNTNPSLQILCNFFTDASMLHGVTLLNGTTGVIAPFQGNCILNADVDIPEYFPTGNRLADSYQSFPGQSDHRHFASFSTEPIVYNHFPGETPEFLPNNITANECDLQDVEKDCSLPDLTPQVTNSCNTDFFKSHVLELEKRITQQSTLLVAYGRDDQSETIRSSGTVKQLKQKIDGFELYLSNNELIAVVEKIGVFEEISDIFNILLDNAPLQYTVREFLAEHINKLPVKIRLQLREQTKTVNQLLTIPTGLSLAQEVEAEVIKYLEDQKYIEPLLQSCLASRVQHEIIEVIKNLADNVSLNKNFFKRKAVEYQIDAALYDDARLSLKTIDSNGDDELKAYKQLKEIEINLKQQNRNATELTSKERTNLKNIAGLNTRSAIQARNALLHFHDSTTVFIPPVLPKDTEWRKPSLVQSSIYSELTDVINPNPATDQIQFNLPLVTGQFNTFKIKVFNGNGQLVKEMEDYSNGNTSYSVRELREGVYIVEISNNELNLRLKDKLIIIR